MDVRYYLIQLETAKLIPPYPETKDFGVSS